MSDTKLKLITPVALISYPHIDKPQSSDDGKPPKYSCALVFTPELLKDPAEAARLKAMEQAAIAAATAKFGADKVQSLFRSETFKKGFRRDGAEKGYPEGSIFINVRSNQQPQCVYPYADPASGKPARVPAEKIKEVFYAGARVRASVTAFAYDNNGNKGVSFALNNLQFIADGERLDGRIAAENEFEADLNAKPADLESLLG